MDHYQPLDCDLHDYLEIACLYGYRLLVELTDGSSFEAKALTTRTTAAKEEFLALDANDGTREVRLDHLLAITPLDPGSRFGRVQLSGITKACTP
ncbi:Rho-binding antiterminator [Pseudomonas sp. LS44]|uniref:Rho-binding antiterminator n=1 Tax=Pseudomonas sp. LS44 TaxID=1357074 RepID=UPI00215A38D3|nr:Rho-binding antiterminator [Pseudomonas sp. LS44]UVE19298.1 Rho-binding antiterminator [Pseudomonas sp. LS44]